jgi:SHS family lactate transporter-like MFS transporter
VLPAWGWRAMFWVGGIPALLAFYIRTKVPESEAWEQHRAGSFTAILRSLAEHRGLFGYLVLLMTFMMFLSHGTQDLYPDFLKSARGIAPATVSYVAILYNVGAVVGAVVFGHLSELLGRRRSLVLALGVSLLVIPLWVFGATLATLALGAFLMQVGVQGAWGVIPAHLNELAPDHARGLVPGLAYQMGILLAAPTNTIEYALRDRLGYEWALAAFEIVTIVTLATITLLGREAKGKEFSRA